MGVTVGLRIIPLWYVGAPVLRWMERRPIHCCVEIGKVKRRVSIINGSDMHDATFDEVGVDVVLWSL